jgi:hypothetical protein
LEGVLLQTEQPGECVHGLSLSTGSIWSFADETGDTIRLSLPEVLRTDTPLCHAPAIGYLAPIQHELLASILQVTVDTIWPRGIRKKDYQNLLLHDNAETVQPLLDRICNALARIEGFSLAGRNAFMQVPAAWRHSGKKMKIARLLWPFIPNIHGTDAKGLRGMSSPPVRLGADLTALFLYTSCCFPKGGTQFWTIGNLAGRAVIHRHLGSTLRQQLFSSILPGYFPSWKPLQPLPWIAQCHNNGGLEPDGRPPGWTYLRGKTKIRGTANLRFFQARAMMLDPPEYGRCDISGKSGPIFISYRLLSDHAAYKMFLRYKIPRDPVKAAGIMGQMYEKTEHPSIADPNLPQKNEKSWPDFSLPYHGYRRPPWYAVPVVLGYPSQIIQAQDLLLPRKHTVPENCTVLLLKYHADKQDVRGIFHYILIEVDAVLKKRAVDLALLAEQSMTILLNGKRHLLNRNSREQKGRRNTLPDYASSALLNSSQMIWNLADILIRKNPDGVNNWLEWAKYEFQKLLKTCWQQVLEDEWKDGCLTLDDLFREFKATWMVLGENMMDMDRVYLDTLPVVRAGRAFAREFQNLDRQEKAQLSNEEFPVRSRYFWTCVNKARSKDPKIFQPMFEKTLPLLGYIKPSEDGQSIGKMLRLHTDCLSPRRVELLLMEEDRDLLIDQVQQILHIITSRIGHPVTFDFGVFLHDVQQFHFQPDTVIRRWATDYFRKEMRNKMEEDHVQA